jgi:hypothetical protein
MRGYTEAQVWKELDRREEDAQAFVPGHLQQAMWAHLPDLLPAQTGELGAYVDGTETRHSHALALTQLLLVLHLVGTHRTF